MQLDTVESVITIAMLLFSFIWGSVFRFLVFKMVRRQGWFHLPINIMIVIKEIFNMIGWTCWLWSMIGLVVSDRPMVDYTGVTFCRAIYYTTAVGIFVGVLCNVGIAVMRAIYIRGPSTINSLREQRLVACLISLICVVLGTTSMVIYVNAPKRTQGLTKLCLGYSSEMALTLYDIAAPNEPPAVAILIVWMGLTTQALTLAIYIDLFRYLVKHDRSLVSLLPETTLRRRKMKNVIDLSGHVTEFMCCILATVIMLITWLLTPKAKLWSQNVWMSLDGIMGICNIAVSASLKNELNSLLSSLHLVFSAAKTFSTTLVGLFIGLLIGISFVIFIDF